METTPMRPSGRQSSALRPVTFTAGVSPYAEGSCLIECGMTKVMCTATVENRVPPFLRGKNSGWVTAEYGMLPRATHSRMDREAARGKQSGRTQEIQRLIGRSLRSVTDLSLLGERQVVLDCDVLQADGGTRTAAINGAYVALRMALEKLVAAGELKTLPLSGQVAAVSCGIVGPGAVLDLDYAEDSTAIADMNFVMDDRGRIIEIQGTAEQAPFTEEQFQQMFSLAQKGIRELIELQRTALAEIKKAA